MPDTDYIEVPLGGPRSKHRGVALVDAADAEAVGAYRWHMHNAGYAGRSDYSGGKRLYVLLHRSLLRLEPGDARQVDHVSGDKLDNRRANLRIATKAQNMQNLHQCGPHRGASWDAQKKRWEAYAGLGGKKHHLGRFDTREEAAAVAAAYRREYMPFSADARELTDV